MFRTLKEAKESFARHPFSKILDRLTPERGWSELCPGESYWRFKKRNWLVTLNWYSRRVYFYNLRSKKQRGSQWNNF